ncbi:MAG: CRISPR-associated protein Cas4 [Deltaproteobacteria bacterium]|nr:CRISPR-associated protein Cas4 [Deltaproteobacteria bacterium]
MNFTEDDLLPLSALQHLLFCERQCALIHNERLWEENLFTAEGNVMHENVDKAHKESRGKVRVDYALPLRSLKLGLSGKADAVEFHREEDARQGGKRLLLWRPFPVEYKRGKPKSGNFDKVQLCAQAMCLEEMTGLPVEKGALFYGRTGRRLDVLFDEELRNKTKEAAARLHELIDSGVTPKEEYSKKCDSCSLVEQCMPKVTGRRKSVKRYLNRLVIKEG